VEKTWGVMIGDYACPILKAQATEPCAAGQMGARIQGEEGVEADVGTAKCNLATCRHNCRRPVLQLHGRHSPTQLQPRSKPSSTDTTTSLR
jgi:hypothetical protein